MTIASVAATPTARQSAPTTQLIDIDAIKSILYLGLKGEVVLDRPDARSSSPARSVQATGHGVDTYA